MSAPATTRGRRPELQRSVAAALYYYPPNAFFAHEALTAQVKRWEGDAVEVRDQAYVKQRLAQRINRVLKDKLPVPFQLSASELVLVAPKTVYYEPAPLTFICPKCRRVREFQSLVNLQKPEQLQCPHCRGERLSQLSYVLIHPCGHIEPLRPRKCQHGHLMTRFVKGDPRDMGTWEFQCSECDATAKVLPALCPKCSVVKQNASREELEMQLKPCTGSGIVVAQHETFVDFPDKTARPSKEVLAEHLGYKPAGGSGGVSVNDATLAAVEQSMKSQGMPVEQIAAVLASIRPAAADGTSWEQRLDGLFAGDDGEDRRDLAEKRVHDYTDLLRDEATVKFKDTPPILDRLGIAAVHYVGSLHVVDTVYGYLVGARKPTDGTLKLFEVDQRRYQVLVNRNQTEGILLTFDRAHLLRLLEREGALGNRSELLGLSGDDPKVKEFFCQAQAGDPDPDVATRDQLVVRSYIHTLAHLLMKTATIYCGIGLEGLSELIFPEIPAVLLYSADKNNLGGIHTLFDTSVKPWLEYSLEAGRSCFNDPRCTKVDNGACHACVHVPEVSCRLWNEFLDRRLLTGTRHE